VFWQQLIRGWRRMGRRTCQTAGRTDRSGADHMMQAGRSLVGPAHWLCPDPHHSFWPCQLFRQTGASGYYSSCCHCSLPALLVIQSRERGRDWGTGSCALLPSPDAFPNLPLDGRAGQSCGGHSAPIHPHPEPRASLVERYLLSNHRQVQRQIRGPSIKSARRGKKEGSLVKSNEETPDHFITSRNQIPHPAGAGDRTGPARAYIINRPSFAPHPPLPIPHLPKPPPRRTTLPSPSPASNNKALRSKVV
jgi:hypothetical protein